MIYKGYNIDLTPLEEAEFLNTLPVFRDAKLNLIFEKRRKQQRQARNYQMGKDAWL